MCRRNRRLFYLYLVHTKGRIYIKPNLPLEIERKYLIEMPNIDWILQNQKCDVAKITQTYLGKSSDGYGNRVRKMEINGETKYYHTAKKSVKGFTRIEIENEISLSEYEKYLSSKKELVSLQKTRYMVYLNHLKYEIDVYPFWTTTAILEVELKDEKQEFEIPEFIKVIGEVTNNLDYSNHSLAKKYSTNRDTP